MKRKALSEADRPEKKLRWDVPKTASLISFYKEHPELWNPKVPEYSNDKLRLKAVETWLVDCQLEPEKDLINEVKLKLHGLRTSYGHELKMEATKKVDGQPYTSKWQWYRQLTFLKEAMCFRARSGSVSSSANGRRSTRRRGRRGHQTLSISDDMDHNHNNGNYYSNDHDGHDVKNVPIDHSDQGSPQGYSNSMVETEYDNPNSHSHIAHHSHHSHPHHHHGLIHMSAQLEEPHHHHIPPGSHSGTSDHLQSQDPHVPVVTYRSRDPISIAAPTPTTSIIRHDGSTSNFNIVPVASSPLDKPILVTAEDQRSYSIPAVCNCKCRSSPQTIGEKLGRLVEETFSNLHPDYHEIARWEIQQTLGKYLQKPIP